MRRLPGEASGSGGVDGRVIRAMPADHLGEGCSPCAHPGRVPFRPTAGGRWSVITDVDTGERLVSAGPRARTTMSRARSANSRSGGAKTGYRAGRNAGA